MDMELEQGKRIAAKVMERLAPSCKKMLVVGSIRREKPRVNDIDLVVIPSNQGQLAVALHNLGEKIKQGPLLYECRFEGVQVDIYVANEQTWVTLVLIRTGSKEHNIKLCKIAQQHGLKLHANGSGLTVDATGEPWKGRIESERDIFSALEVPYLEPKDRG